MPKENISEIYDAIREADANGRTEDVQKLIAYLNQIEEVTVLNNQAVQPILTKVSPEMAAAGGAGAAVSAAAAQAVPKSFLKIGELIEEGRNKKALEIQQNLPKVATPYSGPTTVQGTGAQKWIPSMTGVDVPGGQMSEAGFDTGNKLASIVQRDGPFAGGEVRSGVAIPPDIKGTRTPAKPSISAIKAFLAPVGNAIDKVGQAVAPYASAAGKVLNPIVAGAGVGYGGAEAYNRYRGGDVPGAYISGIGAAGSAASMLPGLVPSLVGNTVALGAEQLNKYRDEGFPYTKKRRPDQSNINDDPNKAAFGFFPQMDVKEENEDKDKFAAGGLAHLAKGKSVAEMANEQLNPQKDERELYSAPFALNINQLPPAPERGSVGDDIALAELMHQRRFGDGSLRMGAKGISVNTPQGRINKLSGVNAEYLHPSGVSVGVEQPFNNPTMKTRANINYTKRFNMGGHIAGYKGGSSVSLFDAQGNPIRQDENAPTQADIDYEKMLAEQNSTLSPKFTARNRAGQPVDPTANIVGPAIEALGNTIYGAGRGALTAMAGLPGDINKLITDNIGTAFNAPALPTTEEIQNFLPGQPTSHEGKISQKLGEFVPVNPMPAVRVAGKGAKTLGETAAEKILTGQPMVPGAKFLNPEMMFAMKPKGGNWRTNIDNEIPLKEQGNLGIHLDKSLIDPKTEWYRQLDDDAKKAYLDWDMRYDRDRITGKVQAESLHDEQNRINDFTNFWNQSPYNPIKIQSFDNIKEKADAYNKWLTTNYKNYITKQMGTGVKTDPVLAEIDKFNSNVFSIKDTPLYIEPSEMDLKRRQALKSFLYKKGNDASLPQNESIGKQTATSEAGKEYENVQDYNVRSSRAGLNDKNLDVNEPIYDILSPVSLEVAGLEKVKDSLLKDVLSGKMSLDKLPNTSMGTLVKKLIDEDAARINALNKDQGLYNAYKVERFNALPAQTEFEDGSKMFEFSKANTTDPLQLLRDLGVDCKDLNHCVVSSHRDSKTEKYIPALEPHTGAMPKGSTGSPSQSYYKNILNGRTNLLSLRDTTGTAQATLQQGSEGVEQIKGYADKEVKPAFIPHIKEWLNNNAGDAPVRDMQNLPGVFDMKSTELLMNENFIKYPWLEQFVTDRISKMPFKDIRDYEVGNLSKEDFMSRIFPNMPRFVDIDDIKNADSFLPKPEFKKGGHVSPAWQRSEGKSESGGLNAAGRASYHRETGGTLKAPQPEGGSRRDSFCARMEGMKKKLTSSETARDPDSRINKSLRKWNC